MLVVSVASACTLPCDAARTFVLKVHRLLQLATLNKETYFFYRLATANTIVIVTCCHNSTYSKSRTSSDIGKHVTPLAAVTSVASHT